MIFLITADNQSFRRTHIEDIIATLPDSDVLHYDDTYGVLADLEQYLFPSLFTIATPIVHVKFMLTESDALRTELLKKLLASPTLFLFEEIMAPAPLIALFKKSGAVVYTAEKKAVQKKEEGIFAATKALTAPDKKSRWLAYRAALTEHPIEAIVGILYWKVRDLATKSTSEKNKYNALYQKLLLAHTRAWESGAPLELMIEKVILTQ